MEIYMILKNFRVGRREKITVSFMPRLISRIEKQLNFNLNFFPRYFPNSSPTVHSKTKLCHMPGWTSFEKIKLWHNNHVI